MTWLTRAMSVSLLMRNHPPVIVFEDDWTPYFGALEAWDAECDLEAHEGISQGRGGADVAAWMTIASSIDTQEVRVVEGEIAFRLARFHETRLPKGAQ